MCIFHARQTKRLLLHITLRVHVAQLDLVRRCAPYARILLHYGPYGRFFRFILFFRCFRVDLFIAFVTTYVTN